MLATFQASTKLCHCGELGKEIPAGTVPCGASAADSMESNGNTENRQPAAAGLFSARCLAVW